MDSGYDVSIDMVHQHATNIVRILDQLDAVQDAAKSQTIPNDAFGLICANLGIAGWLVSPLHDRGVQAVGYAIAKAEELRANLNVVSRAYDQVELDHARLFADQKKAL